MAQNRNVYEWCIPALTAPNDLAIESRVLRGGDWGTYDLGHLRSSFRNNSDPARVFGVIGFRVADVPE